MTSRSRLVLVAALGAAALVGASTSAQTLPTPAAAAGVIDSLARAHLARGVPSVAIALIRGNDTLAFGAWGMANLELEVPATALSVYRIGSVTKQFTAAAVMQLAEQGRLSLDDSIGDHIADLPVAWRPVTVLQLLNHTSGIPSYTGLGETWQRRWGEEMTPDTILAM
ncbi:MAG TPA: serine hydrolase domain-containing protein, partial [Gemmatimonadales bacterium]|nr:serine hydrolase domain-containing protein [Gemmatimonadales bacterium]